MTLPDIQKRLKWRDGHEEEYLDDVLHLMGQWSNTLFPKVKFDDFIEKAEMVSTKRPVKVFVTKMRYGMAVNVVDPSMKLNPEHILSDEEDEPSGSSRLPTMDKFPTADWEALFGDVNSRNETETEIGAPENIEDQFEPLAVPGPSGIDTSSMIAAERMQGLYMASTRDSDDEDEVIGGNRARNRMRMTEMDDPESPNAVTDSRLGLTSDEINAIENYGQLED